MIIRMAEAKDIPAGAEMAVQLWPEHDIAEMTLMFEEILSNREAVCYVALDGEKPVGFCHCQLRHDYVEGAETSPAAYLEAIFVSAAFRRQGVASALLRACEGWAREKGCKELASDCELMNHDSEAFHGRLGFAEANRVICFVKKL